MAKGRQNRMNGKLYMSGAYEETGVNCRHGILEYRSSRRPKRATKVLAASEYAFITHIAFTRSKRCKMFFGRKRMDNKGGKEGATRNWRIGSLVQRKKGGNRRNTRLTRGTGGLLDHDFQ